ncbi:MAG TPA: YbhB/YbcL family Raf kinase inhibitor-like protein [Sphingomonadaceae bacterium]|nr:YbhB/YbcL family Raf kinase inhibitor-like protein [Sphingomonadaceae bacterium]
MLEHVPAWLGALMRNVRAGHSRLAIVDPALALRSAMIPLSSPAFADAGRLPMRFTADGEGVSPPLVWGDVPAGTRSLALIVEDPDAPALNPLVHAIVWDIPPETRRIEEGAILADGPRVPGGQDVGRNSYLGEGWLPPDPPRGHGSHDYVFQIFALSGASDPGETPGRSGMVKAMAGKVLGAGLLVGTYSRDEVAPVGGEGNPIPA